MMERYRQLMSRQDLSDSAADQFLEKLNTAKRPKSNRVLRIALVAACLCILIPLAVFAATGGFADARVEPITNPPRAGKGYTTSFDGASVRPVSDFSPQLQTLNDSISREFDSWQEAEAYIGFRLIDNPYLFSDKLYKDQTIVYGEKHEPYRYHCVTSFVGDGQIFFGNVRAFYRLGDFRFKVQATIVADHPQATEEFLKSVHVTSSFYPGTQVESITTEEFTTQNGLPVSVTTVKKTNNASSDYEAIFFINGVSYNIQVSGHGSRQEVEAKQCLLDILEGFIV